MVSSPVKHTDKERLTWERELLGLYVSAHPLDNYDAYFEEQTIPLMQIKPEVDGKKATIGGLVSSVRTIITKSGSKMAFVGIEDKTGESEIIVFPNLYEQIGAKLVQDAIISATGKISARDREGNLGDDAKMIADEINFITDQELHDYESTGRKMEKPKPKPNVSAQVKVNRSTYKPGMKNSVSAPASTRPSSGGSTMSSVSVEVPSIKKLFVHIKNPDDHESLLSLKKTCSDFPGVSDIVLVLGDNKKSAIKLPFRVDSSEALIGRLVKLLGEDAVVFK